MPLLTAALLVVLMASCGPAYVNTGYGYGPGYYGARPYYGYNTVIAHMAITGHQL